MQVLAFTFNGIVVHVDIFCFMQVFAFTFNGIVVRVDIFVFYAGFGVYL